MSEVVIVASGADRVVVERQSVVAVSAPGPQGAVGPQGPTGPVGGEYMTYSPSSASATWVVDHGLHRHVHVTVLDTDGGEVGADVVHDGSLDRVTIIFGMPFAGTAIIG